MCPPGIRDDKNKKLTASGVSVAEIEKQEEEKEKKKNLEYREIEMQYNLNIGTILPMEIVVIHVNW